MLPEPLGRAFQKARAAARESTSALVLALLALGHVILLASIVLGRLTYPLDIEWMEGGVLTMASRIQHGLPLYTAPSAGYVPFPYPFGYPLLLAALGTVVGQSYVLGRIVSIGFVALSMLLLGREVARAHATPAFRWAFGLAGAGFLAAGFPVVDAWYDLVRVDSMAFGLVVLAACTVSTASLTRTRLGVAAASLALAANTKQNVAPFVVAIVLFACWQHRRRGLMVAGLALGLFLLGFGAAEVLSGGWYAFYTLQLMAGHRVEVPRIYEGLGMLLRFAPYAPLLPIVAARLAWLRQLSPRAVLWGALALLGWGFGASGMAKDGAHVNSLLPAVWFTPAFLLILCGDAFFSLDSSRVARLVRVLGPALLGVDLFCLWYPARNHRLREREWQHARAFEAYVRALPGRVHAPTTPFVASDTGKGLDQLHAQSLGDLKWAKLPYRERYATFLEQSRADWVIVSGRETGIELVYERYQLVDELAAEKYDVTTTVAWRVRPRWVLRRPRLLPRARVLFDFEAELTGWSLKNFRALARPPRGQGPFWGGRGQVLDSFHRRLGDRAVGQALSPSFTLDRTCLSLGVGGGAGKDTRVELEVNGKVVRTASGLEHDALHFVDWDVGALRGELARLRVVDQSRDRWGFVTLDDVVLSDVCGQR